MTYLFHPAYPTLQHEQSAQAVVDYFKIHSEVLAVLLTCSCARGKATRDSCLDLAVLIPPELSQPDRYQLKHDWQSFYRSEAVFARQEEVGAFSQVDLEFHTGEFSPEDHPHGWTSGADAFELEVGNLLAYSALLWGKNSRYQDLQARWLPYYAEDLCRARLKMVLKYCRNNLAHIPLYVDRGLYFQAVKRLQHAIEEFLQCLFITRRTYPIAYDKWVREQVVDILGLPELYSQLVELMQIRHLESGELSEKSTLLENLIERYIKVGG